MNLSTRIGSIGLAVFLGACAALGPASLKRNDVEKVHPYPDVFHQTASGAYGIGFCSLYPYSKEEAYQRAVEMACRSLSWSIRVRVQGERLFERTALGSLEYRGEHIELLDVPAVEPEDCYLETLQVAQRVWITAGQHSGTPGWGSIYPFASAPPAWVSELPQDPGWLFAVGSTRTSYKDEAGSWELAAYQALIDLAFVVGVRTGHMDKATVHVIEGASRLEVDTTLMGFRLVERWRDADHLYVLAGVPLDGAVSHLNEMSMPDSTSSDR